MGKKILITLLAVFATMPALADGGRGWGHGGGWRGDWIFPALIGGAILYDVTRPAPVYVQPAPVYAPSYVQAYTPEVAPPAVQNWYFCAGANGYYPYVRSCPGGWQVVPATPPGAAAR